MLDYFKDVYGNFDKRFLFVNDTDFKLAYDRLTQVLKLCFSVSLALHCYFTCQSDLGAGQAYGADHLKRYYMLFKGQPDNQAQTTWIHEGWVLLNEPDLLL